MILSKLTLFLYFECSNFNLYAEERIVKKNLSIELCDGNNSCDGVCFWWELNMDCDQEQNKLSTSPYVNYANSIYTNESFLSDTCSNGKGHDSCPFIDKKENIPPSWRDHWVQCVRLFSNSQKNKNYEIQCFHDDYSIWFNNASQSTHCDEEAPFCTCGNHHMHFNRVIQLHDSVRWKLFESAISNLFSKNPNTIAMQISEGSVLGLISGSI